MGSPEQLQAERSLARAFVDSSPLMTFSVAEGVVDCVNQAWQRETGVDEAGLLGEGWLALVGDRQEVKTTWRQGLADGLGFELRFILQHRRYLLRMVPAVGRWFGTTTEVEMAEVQQERSARLEAERNLRLNEMFLGILAHDLRNPMSAIAMGAALLQRTVPGEKEAKVLGRVVESSGRMGRMIDQLLDFTRIRLAGGLTLSRESVDLRQLCERVMEELETARPGSGLKLGVAGDTTGEWDADRISQALSNLVGNALDHGAGGVVEIDITGDDEGVSLSIRNQGMVPTEMLPVLFDPFRGNKEEKRRKGLGLGLYITQQIVFAHGGTIEVVSSLAEGTTFGVRLPHGSKEDPSRTMNP